MNKGNNGQRSERTNKEELAFVAQTFLYQNLNQQSHHHHQQQQQQKYRNGSADTFNQLRVLVYWLAYYSAQLDWLIDLLSLSHFSYGDDVNGRDPGDVKYNVISEYVRSAMGERGAYGGTEDSGGLHPVGPQRVRDVWKRAGSLRLLQQGE